MARHFLGFGDGSDGTIPSSGTLDTNNSIGYGSVTGSSGSTSLSVTDRHAVYRIQNGDIIMIHQTTGSWSNTGNWELNQATETFGTGTKSVRFPLEHTYATGAQVIRVPQYAGGAINGNLYSRTYDGYTGGIAVFCYAGLLEINGSVAAAGRGWRDRNYHSLAYGGGNGESYDGFVGKGGHRIGAIGWTYNLTGGTSGGGNAHNTTRTRAQRTGGGGGATYNSDQHGQGDEGCGGGGGGGHATAGGGGGGGGDCDRNGGYGGATSTSTSYGGGNGAAESGCSTRSDGGAPTSASPWYMTGYGGNCGDPWNGGTAAGAGGGIANDSTDGSKMWFGGAGGEGGAYRGSQPAAGFYGGDGGHGGGIVLVYANYFDIDSGYVSAEGQAGGNGLTDGAGDGGGGAGGFINIFCENADIGTNDLRTNGGAGYEGSKYDGGGGGDGGRGRIAIQSCGDISGGLTSSSYYGTYNHDKGGHDWCSTGGLAIL